MLIGPNLDSLEDMDLVKEWERALRKGRAMDEITVGKARVPVDECIEELKKIGRWPSEPSPETEHCCLKFKAKKTNNEWWIYWKDNYGSTGAWHGGWSPNSITNLIQELNKMADWVREQNRRS